MGCTCRGHVEYLVLYYIYSVITYLNNHKILSGKQFYVLGEEPTMVVKDIGEVLDFSW